MREIKFRAWSVDYKKMLPVHDASFVNGRMIGAKGVGWDDTVEVMQYTGLKDRTGKEIYEGDVIQEDKRLLLVEWDDSEAAFGQTLLPFDGTPDVSVLCDWHPKYTKVVGNRYENPELLK